MKREEEFQVYLKRVALGEATGFKASLVRLLLTLLEPVYLLLLRTDRYLSRPKSLPVPVISIGNLVAGGTGKTPLVIWLVKYLRSLGRQPAILTRGYQGRRTADGTILSSNDLEKLTPELTGDEPYLLAKLLPGTLIGIGKDRYRTGLKVLAAEPGVDCFVLDDAFQYWNLKRDLDLVLIDAGQPFGNRRLLPRGLLREPLKGLKRAAVVLLTRTSLVSNRELNLVKEEIKKFNPAAQIANVQVEEPSLTKMVNSNPGATVVPAAAFLKGRRIAAVCAIGNPRQFFDTLQSYGAQLGYQRVYPDHYQWEPAEIELLAETVKNEGCSELVITAKDAVKLAAFVGIFQSSDLECYILSLDFNVTENDVLDRLRLILEKGA